MSDSFNQKKRPIDREIYIASMLSEKPDKFGNIPYAEPKKLYCCLNTASSSSDIAMYGERIKRMYKTLLDYDKFNGVFKENDKVYLEGITPDGEEVNGANANYKIESIRPQLKKIVLYFERIEVNNG